MTIGDWVWDETLFEGASAYYAAGRPPYVAGWVDVLVDTLELDGLGRLADVGCGPGTLGLALADRFAEVVGLDPDDGMIAQAASRAEAAGLAGRTRWIEARAEQWPEGLGTFTVAVFGQSFHWMDRDLVAAKVRDALVPGGACVLISKPHVDVLGREPVPHPATPTDRIKALAESYLGPVWRAGQGTLPNGTPGGESAVLERAGFGDFEGHLLPGGAHLERTADVVVAEVFSLSGSAPHLFGERLAEFEADLRRLLAEVSPSGLFSRRQPSTEIRIWRRP
ncbi:class I SAM-dependent methyltransferase [Actinospica robiniae]|uniref:class I SAM-dependent methyltransferase n=1 Tax=Actinospica robiniae TaxID=304901 RepID=UPI0003F5EF90|nr:class I SAM-dependent methyltransferase [Actinospica robiniae]